MAYEAHKWKIGEEITSDKLNHIEKGIEEAGLPREITDPQDGQTLKYDAAKGVWVNVESGSGSSTLVVNATTDDETGITTLDKTWKEISDAFKAGMPVLIASSDEETNIVDLVLHVGRYSYTGSPVSYEIRASNTTFGADSETGYPTAGGGQ